jgi:hypothetical protein
MFYLLKYIWNRIDALIPSFVVEVDVRKPDIKIFSKRQYLEHKEEELNQIIQDYSEDDAIETIFSNIKYCNFVVFQSNTDDKFFQFGIRKHGYFLDYPNTRIIGNVKNFQRTITFLEANGLKKTDPNKWECMKYFVIKDKKRSYINAYFGKDMEIIRKCIIYLLLEVYNNKLSDYKIILG